MRIAKSPCGALHFSVGEILPNASAFKTYYCGSTRKYLHTISIFFSILMKQYKYSLYSKSKPNLLKLEE